MEYDFKDGNGPVPAHKHSNGGGWVSNTATVDETAYVGLDARVSGGARVYGDAAVYGNARVYGNAEVSGKAKVSGNADVYGNASVSGGVYLKRGRYSKTPTSITRGDGYTFTIQSDMSIVAGCRDFTPEEAELHWGNPEHHMHKESYAILKALIAIHEAR